MKNAIKYIIFAIALIFFYIGVQKIIWSLGRMIAGLVK